ncbi:MAG: Ldh family oxidoreductase, partial [Candidatus Binatia bacterium]|nr:Ldh family oxidoreductase [Candidatus Binatia bacterium]
MPKFSHDELLKFGAELLLAAGLPRDDSRLVAKLLLKGELDGYPGHGISRIPSYVSRIKQGVIRLDRPKVIREGKSTAVIDGNFAIGQIVAQEGMN